ncbi:MULTISPECIES: hypothetical protein [unclassified Corynebacterium]|uniref:hypothetical protein n=1 Tax=unclassified Corynebacterium TaxID=2624378 RepID=UPI002652D9DC|nr:MULTISPECIES: hypothetical protein [unclassified Corynebacterium]MDN8594035.1 hypothetical protein [Corynebacterium sp. P4_F2]WKK54926.1 hypothetical protein QYR03_06720 [Corynebacterium sp. P4-C1]WKK64321.1 hypothetical protein QYR04_05440 [Corynebacterium sp. P8-C1]
MTNQQPPFGGGFPQPGSGNSDAGGSSVWGSGAPSGSSAGSSPWGSTGAGGFGEAPQSSPWGNPGDAGSSGGQSDPFAPAPAAGDSFAWPGSTSAPSAPAPGGGTGSSTAEPSSAPTTWLVPGLVLGVAAVVMTLILLFGSISPVSGTYAGMAFGAWALAGLLGVSSLAFYFSEDTRRRANGMYSIVGWKQGLYWATLAVLFIAIILSSLCIALWVGRL